MAWIVSRKKGLAHWSIVLGLLGVAGATVAWTLPSSEIAGLSKQANGEEAKTLSPSVYSRVMRLRSDHALTNADLAALGLSEEQATEVLERLVQGVETNEGEMIQADNQLRAAKGALASLERRVRTGQADEREAEQVQTLRRAVAEAQEACQSLDERAGEYALSQLPRDVNDRWQAACQYRALPVELRHVPNLDSDRLADFGGVGSSGERGLSAYDAQALAAVRGRIQSNLPEIQRAEEEVLPPLVEFLDDAIDLVTE